VSAFEQSLSNVTQKLQKLTVASERKVNETRYSASGNNYCHWSFHFTFIFISAKVNVLNVGGDSEIGRSLCRSVCVCVCVCVHDDSSSFPHVIHKQTSGPARLLMSAHLISYSCSCRCSSCCNV